MIGGFIVDIAKLTLLVGSLYFAIGAYVRHSRPISSRPFERRRSIILSLLVLGVLILDVTEDTIGGDSGPIDQAILLLVHHHAPSTLNEFFDGITWTGSSTVLFPLTIIASLALALTKHRYEALFLIASVTTGAMVTYAVKSIVGRARPALWATDWYWGSSFPSGHTLVVASFATAASICVARLWPAMHRYVLSVALVWIFLVALSRLIVGVHWPTDVIAAACIGAFVPLAMSFAFEPSYPDVGEPRDRR